MALDPADPLAALAEQWKHETRFFQEERAKQRLPDFYGDPFARSNPNRMHFWVRARTRPENPMPLHALCARLVLCAPGATATNERSHKHADQIQTKCRSRLTTAHLEEQLLASISMRKIVKEYARVLELDVDEAEREGLWEEIIEDLYPEESQEGAE